MTKMLLVSRMDFFLICPSACSVFKSAENYRSRIHRPASSNHNLRHAGIRELSASAAFGESFSPVALAMHPTPKTPGWFLLTRHWISLLGVALIVTASISSLFMAPNEIRGHAGNPYDGIVLLVVLPALFFSG